MLSGDSNVHSLERIEPTLVHRIPVDLEIYITIGEYIETFEWLLNKIFSKSDSVPWNVNVIALFNY